MMEAMIVEVRSIMVVSKPVVPLDVGMMVDSVELVTPVLTEDEFMLVVNVRTPEVEGVGVIADIVVLPLE